MSAEIAKQNSEGHIPMLFQKKEELNDELLQRSLPHIHTIPPFKSTLR
jgi:hypothetical protein